MPAPQYPQVELATRLQEPRHGDGGRRLHAVYKGKFHCNKPANGKTAVPAGCQSTASRAGIRRTRAPTSSSQSGGGSYDNDGRFMNDEGTADAGAEGVLQYLVHRPPRAAVLPRGLARQPARRAPLSEDVSSTAAMTTRGWRATSSCPRRCDEDLSTKPTVQAQFLRLSTPGRLNTAGDEAQLPQLLRQPDEGLGRVPGDVLDTLETTACWRTR